MSPDGGSLRQFPGGEITQRIPALCRWHQCRQWPQTSPSLKRPARQHQAPPSPPYALQWPLWSTATRNTSHRKHPFFVIIVNRKEIRPIEISFHTQMRGFDCAQMWKTHDWIRNTPDSLTFHSQEFTLIIVRSRSLVGLHYILYIMFNINHKDQSNG